MLLRAKPNQPVTKSQAVVGGKLCCGGRRRWEAQGRSIKFLQKQNGNDFRLLALRLGQPIGGNDISSASVQCQRNSKHVNRYE